MAKNYNFEKLLEEGFENATQHFYDEDVEENADFRAESGIKAIIKRTVVGETCPWCEELEGVYEYGKHPKDIFRRHRNCDCVVEYITEKERTNVHTKITFDRERKERIELLKNIDNYDNNYSLKSKYKINQIKYQDVEKVDNEVIEIIKEEFKGYKPSKLVDGDKSICYFKFNDTKNSINKSIYRAIVNKAYPAEDTNVDLGNPALANSIHERIHDVVNQLIMNKVGIKNEQEVSPIQEYLFRIEKEDFIERMFNVFDDIHPKTANDVYNYIKQHISVRAAKPIELLPEASVAAFGFKKHDKHCDMLVDFLKKEWKDAIK